MQEKPKHVRRHVIFEKFKMLWGSDCLEMFLEVGDLSTQFLKILDMGSIGIKNTQNCFGGFDTLETCNFETHVFCT